MGRRRLTCLVAMAILAGVVSVSASASASAGRPPGSPDLAAMALALSDLPAGARVGRQRYYRDPDFLAAYEREFSLGGLRLGRSRLLSVFNDLSLEPSAIDADTTFESLRSLLRRKSSRDELAREVASEGGTTVTSVTVGRPRTPRIGDGAVSILVRIKAERLAFQVVLTFIRVDRVLGIVALFGSPGRKVYAADADRLGRVSGDRMRAGLVATPKLPPVISGTLEPGQVLTATRGTWTGDQLVFSYQWERCSDAGSGCVAIPAATAATYGVAPGDLASTLRVAVVAGNGLGSVTASSTPTAVIAGPQGAPVATVAPAVTGIVEAGATLSVDSGTWTESPTTFTYQWRRCDASGGSCVDVADATGSTYTVASSDSGSTLRVLVVATNAVGSGGAISAATAAVP